jgi:hypothetical protein
MIMLSHKTMQPPLDPITVGGLVVDEISHCFIIIATAASTSVFAMDSEAIASCGHTIS